MTLKFLIRLPWPDQNLSSNKRVHWSVRGKATSAARKQAWPLALHHGVNKPMPDAELRFTYHPPDKRKRDAQNMPHMLKAQIDGISDAMGCDDSGFEVVFPRKFSEVAKGGCILVEITPKSVVLPVKGAING